MTAVSICLSLSNAARGADACADSAFEKGYHNEAHAQRKLANEFWKIAEWWANNIQERL